MPISALTIDITARMASLEKDMGKVAQLSEQAAHRMDRAFSKAGLALGTIFAGVGFAGAAQGFRNVVDQLDALNDAADATGASIENLSALEDIGKRTGVAFEDVTGILVKFNQVLNSADAKNDAGKVLKEIGLNAEELKRMDPAEALRVTAAALAKFADDGGKARRTQILFGKSVKDVAPYLKDVAEAGGLNAKVTTEQAEAAERFNKQVFALQANLSELGRTVVSAVLPAVQDLIAELNDGVKAYGSFSAALVDIGLNVDPTKTLNENLATTTARLRAIREEQEEIAKVQAKYKGNPLMGAYGVDQSKKLSEERRELEKREAYLRTRSLSLEDGGRGRISSITAPDKPKPELDDVPGRPTAEKGKDSDAQRYIEKLHEQIATVNELTAVQQANFDLTTRELAKATPGERASILALAEKVDGLREEERMKKGMLEVDELIRDLAREKSDEEAEQARTAQGYYEASFNAAEQLEKKLRELAELNEKGAFGLGNEGAEKYRRAVEAAKSEQDKLNDSAKEFSDIMMRAIENGDDLGEALERIAMKAFVFDPLSKSLEDMFSGLTKGSGGGSAPGGIPFGDIISGGMKLLGFANGGSPPVGVPSIVGERGPELFIPKASGTIVPNHKLGGQQVVINMPMTFGSDVSMNTLAAWGQQIERRVQNAIIYSKNANGAHA